MRSPLRTLSSIFASVSVLGMGCVPSSAAVVALSDGANRGVAAVVARSGAQWVPPLGAPLHISGPYAAPPGPYASGHRGIDLPASPGALVRAPASGTVSFVGKVVDRGVVSLRINSNTLLSLEPLEPDPELAVGDWVARGQELGIASDGGHCAAECVHLGVRVDGEYVNPGRFFFAKPVLLPW